MNGNVKNIEFIKKANLIHSNKFDYSEVKYKNNHTKIKIICPEHGVFEQTPNNHLTGKKCKLCAMNSRIIKNTSNNKSFITKSSLIHFNKYNYSLTEYNGVKEKVKIICTEHGVFEQIPDNHLRGHGCPNCKQSKGEILIKKILEENNIKIKQQKKFKDCRDKNPLSFDFYLPDHHICIEYDGEQHNKSVKYWGGDDGLKDRQKKDKIKTDYCKNNNLILIRVKHSENIELKINKLLNL